MINFVKIKINKKALKQDCFFCFVRKQQTQLKERKNTFFECNYIQKPTNPKTNSSKSELH